MKPAVPKELSARVRALQRRSTRSGTQQRMRFGDLDVVPDAGVVRLAGKEVSLTKTEFGLLCELAQAPGRILTREVLLDQVWGYDYFGDGRLVDVHVRRLRTKVETPIRRTPGTSSPFGAWATSSSLEHHAGARPASSGGLQGPGVTDGDASSTSGGAG